MNCDENPEFDYNKFRKCDFSSNMSGKIWPFVFIGGCAIVLIGGIWCIVSLDGNGVKLVGQKPGLDTATTTKNKRPYKPEPFSWSMVNSKQVGSLTVRVYNGNITQIGHGEDIDKVPGLDDSQHTAIVNLDNNYLNPGVLSELILYARNDTDWSKLHKNNDFDPM